MGPQGIERIPGEYPLPERRAALANGRYVLDGHRPVPCPDLMTWGRWYEASFEDGSHWLARDQINEVVVSTIFVALDMKRPASPDPVLFETLVLAPDSVGPDEFRFRYRTWDAAVTGHKLILGEVWSLLLCEVRAGGQDTDSVDDLWDRLLELEL